MKELYQKLYHSKPFRYLATAGIATVVDVSVYFVMFNYIIKKTNLEIGELIIGAPTLSLILSFTCGLMTNFFLTKNFVFDNSDLKSSSQFIRFVVVAIAVFISNYYLMNFLIKVMDWYPTLSRGFSAISIGVLSFLTHKTFSFRTKNG
jgi:putative flippase GtrA